LLNNKIAALRAATIGLVDYVFVLKSVSKIEMRTKNKIIDDYSE